MFQRYFCKLIQSAFLMFAVAGLVFGAFSTQFHQIKKKNVPVFLVLFIFYFFYFDYIFRLYISISINELKFHLCIQYPIPNLTARPALSNIYIGFRLLSHICVIMIIRYFLSELYQANSNFKLSNRLPFFIDTSV